MGLTCIPANYVQKCFPLPLLPTLDIIDLFITGLNCVLPEERFIIHLLVPSVAWYLGEGMATHPSILAWRIHGERSLVGYSPWGHKESDTPT